jgi:hypothetical protein
MHLRAAACSYARGFDVQWDEFLSQAAPVASRVPWMVAAGNHERDSPATSTSTLARTRLSYYRWGHAVTYTVKYTHTRRHAHTH